MRICQTVVFWTLLLSGPVLGQGAEPISAEGAGQAEISIPKYNARHTFEIHQASLLHKLIKEELSLSPEQQTKIEHEFADFIRRTMEDKPRPILIAYAAQDKLVYEGKQLEAEGDTTDKLLEEKTPSGGFSRPLLVDLIRDHLDTLQLQRFQVIVNRWNTLRPPPLDSGLQRLGRALRDPQLNLRKETREAAFAEIKTALEGIPKAERQPKFVDKYEPQARERVLAKLPPERAEQLKQTLAFMEADHNEWGQPAYVVKVYTDAVRTLEQADAKAKTDEAPKPAGEKTPTPEPDKPK